MDIQRRIVHYSDEVFSLVEKLTIKTHFTCQWESVRGGPSPQHQTRGRRVDMEDASVQDACWWLWQHCAKGRERFTVLKLTVPVAIDFAAALRSRVYSFQRHLGVYRHGDASGSEASTDGVYTVALTNEVTAGPCVWDCCRVQGRWVELTLRQIDTGCWGIEEWASDGESGHVLEPADIANAFYVSDEAAAEICV